MKVLIVHNFYRNHGGEETAVFNKKKLLESDGITVEIFSKKNSDIGGVFDKILIFFSSIFSFKVRNSLRKKIKTFKPDIIEVHNIFPLISPSIFFETRKLKIPTFYYLHNYRFICGSSFFEMNNQCCDKCGGNFFKAVFNKCYRNSLIGSLSLSLNNLIHKSILKTWKNKIDYFFIMNKNNIKYYSNYGIDDNKIIYLPHFTFMNNQLKNKKNNYALFVGEFSIKKGFITLMKAFKTIDFNLKIIGKIKVSQNLPVLDHLSKLDLNINKIGFINENKTIENIGFVKNEDIADYYANAAFTIFPSEWEEPFGYVLIESFANKTPVIASDQPSIKKIVKNKFNGILFRSGDHQDLREKIKWMIKNKNEVEKMSLNSKKYFDYNFSPKNNLNLIKKIYSKAIQEQLQ